MTHQSAGLPVIVAGGGIGGLAAALTLARTGYSVRVLEQAPEFGEVGAGIQLGPNVFKMFEYLGLTTQVSEIAVFPGNLVMMDGVDGQEVLRLPVGSTAFRRRFGYPYGVIHRADVHGVFLRACRQTPGIELSVSHKVVGFEDLGDRVRIDLKDRAPVFGQALIGADGLWSGVRERIVGDGRPRVSGHIAYRAVLKREEVPEHLWSPDVVLWAGPKTHLVHYPLRRGELFNLVAVFHSDRYEEGWDAYGDPDELHAKFSGARPEVKTLLEKINTWKMWVLCDREPVAKWSKERVTLLGDAAHPMLQYLAQGACMAIEDAVTLAGAVKESNGNFEQAFARYEQARYLRTARVQLTARFYGELYHAAGVTREVRNQLLGGPAPENPTFDGVAWLYDGINPPRASTP